MELNRIYHGDTIETMRSWPDAFINTCVTSPPYFGLRQYLFDKAVVVKYALTDEEKQFVEAEIKKRGILPRKTDGTI